MIVRSEQNYIQSYENAVTQLQESPNDIELQYEAVLSLARIGSTHFALAEYQRYGLNKVRHHEDIMSLGGRISKDLYLTTTGHLAKQHALDSAQSYEAAYIDTQGYYSGINSATMALMADMPEGVIKTRAQHINQALPSSDNLTPTDYYFIEATRAECCLLLGEPQNASDCLENAIGFDPLNYTAHAATLKQFRLILQKQGASLDWLKKFTPPRPAHFAGHLWKTNHVNKTRSGEALHAKISDAIQQNDIGYGFGALAAGSDIIIAEALVQEGAELHIILPTNEHHFIENSVRPFGEEWVPRFTACLQQAKSVKILSPALNAQREDLDLIAGNIAMGQAIMKGHQFDVEATQLLILDGDIKDSMTSLHAVQWQKKKLSQSFLSVSVESEEQKNLTRNTAKTFDILLMSSQSKELRTFNSLSGAVSAARDELRENDSLSIGLAYAFDDAAVVLSGLTSKALPNTILMSEDIASTIALLDSSGLNIIYAGIITSANDETMHIYALKF